MFVRVVYVVTVTMLTIVFRVCASQHQQGVRSQPIDICSSINMLESEEEEEELPGDLSPEDVGILVIES